MKKTKLLKDGQYEYNEGDLLGEGTFASVFKGVITKNNRVVAIRLLPKELLKKFGDQIKNIIMGEAAVLKDLSLSPSPDTIFTTKIFDCFQTVHNVVMILEYCDEGNLDDIVKKQKSLPENKALLIIYQLARGLQFIASQNILHRDIKPDNVFIRKEFGNIIFKLGDFGFAVKRKNNSEILGTPIYMSPELFAEVDYGSEVDVWAFGLMCHYILFGENYFIAATEAMIKKRVLNEPYSLKDYHKKKISREMADFLTGCLQMKKEQRMPATKIAQHPVFNPIKQQVEQMMKEVQQQTTLLQSDMIKNSAKGRLLSQIAMYSFFNNLADAYASLQPYNKTSLYIYKYNLGELTEIHRNYQQKSNWLQMSDWDKFCSSEDYNYIYKFLNEILTTVKKCFEQSFNAVLTMIDREYGPEVTRGVNSNLGDGPYCRIKPNILVYDLKNEWIPKLSNKQNQESHELSLQSLLLVAILQNQRHSFDFAKYQIMKNSLSVAQKIPILQDAIRKISQGC